MFVSTVTSPDTVRLPSVPTLVILVCAAVAIVPVRLLTTKLAAAYPVALVFTVDAGSVCVSANNLNVLSVEAS